MIQPGGINEESDQWGYMALRILKVHEKQKALDAAPWFAPGGDWTFLECATEKDPSVRVLIGNAIHSSPKGDVPISWGEAMIAVSDATAGAHFVDVLAKAFHQTPPPSHGQEPTLQVKMQTAVLGTGLVRDPHGGFKDGRNGSWVATKWFLQDDMAEAEVFFNFSTKEQRAEFSEKDEEYREDLIQQLVVGLRDGPLPERTMENDPSLTTNGPSVSGWIKVANSNETCQFSRDSRSLFITTTEPKSQLLIAPTSQPANRTLLAEFQGSIFVQEHVVTAEGLMFLVNERLPQEAKTISTTDQQRLWLVATGTKREIIPPAGVTNWFAAKGCLSPDGRFVALGCWEAQPGQKRARVVHVTDLRTGKWVKSEIPATILELVAWSGQQQGVVLTGLGIKPDEVRSAYSLDPMTGQLTPMAEVPPEFMTGRSFSSDGKHSIEVVGKERLIITDTASGQTREFVFHPYDRRNIYPDSVQWADNRHLVFQSARTSLIDTDTLKMNYPTAKGSGVESVVFSPDFRLALGHKSDGYELGKVAPSN